jgi:ubiquinone/menaquinone biosynthesis C-methylase UbiE
MTKSVLDFWNDRAKLQSQAGSNDVTAKSLEIEAIAKYFRDGMQVAEFGCGNGITALEMARRFDVTVDAYDFAPEMVKEAKALAATVPFADRVRFDVADVTKPPQLEKQFDIVFTERVIINLPDWNSQLRAISALAGYLKVGGKLLLVENSATGLAEINRLRVAAGLTTIVKPWHNIYLDDEDMASASVPGCKLTAVVPYSATYYFLSRVVNAWLAKQEGKEPSYDAPVNQLAQFLPAVGDHAQGKLWVWEREQ